MPQPPPLYAPRYLSAVPAMPRTRAIRVVMQNSSPNTLARVKSVFANYAQLVSVIGIKKESDTSFVATVAAAPRSELDINVTAYNLARDMATIQSARAEVLGEDMMSGLGLMNSAADSDTENKIPEWAKTLGKLTIAGLALWFLYELE